MLKFAFGYGALSGYGVSPAINSIRKKSSSIDLEGNKKYDENLNCFDDFIVQKHYARRPCDDGTVEYFTQLGNDNKEGGIAAIIPCFNEEYQKLIATIRSMHKCYKHMCSEDKAWENKPLNIMIIQDGWEHAHPSMKEYLTRVFGVCELVDELNNTSKSANSISINVKNNNLLSLENTEKQNHDHITYIFEKKTKITGLTGLAGDDHTNTNDDNLTCYYVDSETNERLKLNLTLVIKHDNRGKYNSYEWFLGLNAGFADKSNADYLFGTDTFIQFKKDCLFELVKFLQIHPMCAAVTGVQRGMTRRQQLRNEKEYFLFDQSNLLRNIQTCDYEMMNITTQLVFSVLQFIAVIHGTCGMFRKSLIMNEDVIDWFFSMNDNSNDILVGNLRLAEDRLIGMSLICNIDNVELGYCFDAIFYMDTEIALNKLAFQRRRWNNASLASFLAIVFDKRMILQVSIFKKYFIYFIAIMCIVFSTTLQLMPAIQFTVANYAIDNLLNMFFNSNNGYNDDNIINFDISAISNGIMSILWLFWIIFIIVHNRSKYYSFLWQCAFILSPILTCLMVFESTLACSQFIGENDYKTLLETIEKNFLFVGSIVVMILLLICSLVLHFSSFFTILKHYIFYVLWMPLIVMFISTYATARIHDISWGNRPSNSKSNQNATNISKFIAGLMIISNFLLFYISVNYSQYQLYLYIIILLFCDGFLFAIVGCTGVIYKRIKYSKYSLS